MSQAVDELWNIAGMLPHVDAETLAAAIEAAASDDLDYRTRLLIRDSLDALASHWGRDRFDGWLRASPLGNQILKAVDSHHFDDEREVGFPSLKRRVMDTIQPDTLDRFLRALATHVTEPTKLIIGGSVPLILAGHLSRKTDDVDVVDEVPAQLRTQYRLLAELEETFKLHLAHFQSHYLPSGWNSRLHSYAVIRQLQVFLVDPYDIFVGKLFSARLKDRADLNAMTSHLNHAVIRERARTTTTALRSDPRLLDVAKQNWFILFGEDLPD